MPIRETDDLSGAPMKRSPRPITTALFSPHSTFRRKSMRTRRWFFVSMIIQLIAMPIAAQERGGQRGNAPAAVGPAMTLTIPAFPDGGQIPVKFSQAAEGAAPGEGTSPAISWANPPAGTQSFVLNMHDMDVSRNRTTDDQAHWVVWNIPATAAGLPEGVKKGPRLPDGSYQISATGQVYRGPGAARPEAGCVGYVRHGHIKIRSTLMSVAERIEWTADGAVAGARVICVIAKRTRGIGRRREGRTMSTQHPADETKEYLVSPQ